MQAKAVPWQEARRIDVHNHVRDVGRGGGGVASGSEN
jgi:hypothetical protein